MPKPRTALRSAVVAAVALDAMAALGAGCAATSGPAASTAPPGRPGQSVTAGAPAHRESRAVTISAVGDMILGNTPQVPAHPRQYLAPVRRQIGGGSQLVFANLEGTLTTATDSKCSSNGGSCFAFRNPPHFGRTFARTGFTLLNDANNHSHDYGSAGLRQTLRSIRGAGMKQTGLPGEITVVRAGGVKVAVVGFAPYSNTANLLDRSAAAHLIRRAARRAAVVVVYMHAGAEGTGAQHVTGHEETYLGEDRGNPRAFAHLAIRRGADLVIASGPHVLRGMEFYRHKLVAYSLGNFANFHNFGGGGVLSDSGILHVRLRPDGRFLSGRLLSVHLDGTGRARPGGHSLRVVRRLSASDFGASAVRLGRRGVIRPRR